MEVSVAITRLKAAGYNAHWELGRVCVMQGTAFVAMLKVDPKTREVDQRDVQGLWFLKEIQHLRVAHDDMAGADDGA